MTTGVQKPLSLEDIGSLLYKVFLFWEKKPGWNPLPGLQMGWPFLNLGKRTKGEMYSVVKSFFVRNWESTAIGDYPIYYDIKFRCVKNTNENVVQKTRISTKYRSVEPSHQAGPGSHFNHLRNASDIATLEVISTRANRRPASRQYLSTS